MTFSEQNRIYVLDAVNGTLVAFRDLGQEGESPFQVSDLGSCNDISGTIGITGTPIIDPETDTAYFWAKTYKTGETGWHSGLYQFHAVDIASLIEKQGFPTNIEGIPGKFSCLRHNADEKADNDKSRYFTGGNVLQRTSLNMVNGFIVSGFGGHCK
jgi:hypothetical protein